MRSELKEKNNLDASSITTPNNNDSNNFNSNRSIKSVINSKKTTEGAGFIVHRPFPNSSLSYFDPFILLDEMGPMDLLPGEAKGAPDHPHRGFETVTYMLEGEFEHKDSNGNRGKLNPGDIQWMTAGSGVIHSEMPSKELLQKGGILHGFQLWVNLPKKDKMMKPRYQDISAAKIPIAKTRDDKVIVRVIAGESLGAHAITDIRTPIMYLHFTIQPGTEIVQPVPKEYNAFAYVISGKGIFARNNGKDKVVQKGQMVVFGNDGTDVFIKSSANSESPLEILLIGGIPLNEPIYQYGPFVMNTQEEIHQAIDDYRSGKMGKIDF